MVLAEGFRPVIQGLGLGLMLGVLARMSIRVGLDAPVAIVDPLAFLIVPIPIALAASLACRIPAYRASRVDPNIALRHL
jgi:ABC-type antimicrobial peptide transport system permease subunit